jgi:hypothetical protein
MDRLTPRNCSIGILSYLGRFEKYFQPLIRQLWSVFPDYDINVFINGHYDKARQVQYLKEVTDFLRSYQAIRYVTHWEHQPLARGWNWLMLLAQCDQVLILNDDLSIRREFRHHLEHLRGFPEIFTLNGSFSHFVVSKAIIRKVGWFDERFLGVGDEDGDYICRLAKQGIPLGNIPIRGLHNYVAPQKDCGWAPQSDSVHGKYARMNREFFLRKWHHSEHGPVPVDGSFRVKYGVEEWMAALNEQIAVMPQFYPMECLKAGGRKRPGGKPSLLGIGAKICSRLDAVCQGTRLLLGFSWRGLISAIRNCPTLSRLIKIKEK